MSEFKYNNKTLKHTRKALRNNMTEAEIVLWSQLKGKQLLNFYLPLAH